MNCRSACRVVTVAFDGGLGAAQVLAATKYNAAVRYAASQTNFLGGKGLLYPMKSSVVRSMVADANATAASGGLMSLDLPLGQGFATECTAWPMEAAVESHHSHPRSHAPAHKIGKDETP